MNSNNLNRLLRPRSLAVVGASDDPRSVSGLVQANLSRFNYTGEVHLVSRSRPEVNGKACVPSIHDLPEGIDAAVIITPQAGVLDAISACAARGIGGAVVFASGFSELGCEGRELQEKIARTAREAGIALLGPNCMGFVNFADGVPLTFEPVSPLLHRSGPRIGIIAQSGAINANLRQAFAAKGINVSFSVSTGNEAVLSAEDLLTQLVEASEVDAFAIFVEMIRKPDVFLSACGKARAAGKPVVLMHPGRSPKAREAAQSHTGALAGDYEVMRTLVERQGVVVVDTLDELFDVTDILARFPKPVTSGNAAVVSNSGAIRGISIDFCSDLGLELASLQGTTLNALKEMLPDFATPDNPLDLTSAGMQQPELFGATVQAMLDDSGVGSVVVALMGGSAPQQVAKAKSLLPVIEKSDKPVAFVIMGDGNALADEFNAMVFEGGVPFFRSPDRALRAMAHVHRYGQLVASSGRHGASASVPRLMDLQPGPIAEYKGKEILRQLGLATPEGGLARTVDEAIDIAGRIGFPVVIKAQADSLTHKSDVGGVAVGIKDNEALRGAWKKMHDSIGNACPDLRLEGLLIESMAKPGLELVIGSRRDPLWGVIMLVGLGGIWIEALKDVRLLAPDLDEAEIIAALKKLKGAAMFSGLRGQAPVDLAPVARAVRLVANLMTVNPEIAEVDINPFIAYPSGRDGIALDALFAIAGPR
ncbi:acetate--CoA ligase family protein [Noviherbaspirillum saxi]|uniref:CoA-binding protein n=1 Tax=Noviherbaspirillum saxi TaxID=2320863 RepID=A0A3A3G2H5_9BURK|nr:acetate--CoA ligase family protein [Noviherbaspirillum saxi]RJF92263.1 CoA-binding protein [Noviherbaspirillum saxi]